LKKFNFFLALFCLANVISISSCFEPPHQCDIGASPFSCDTVIDTNPKLGSYTVTETSGSTTLNESGTTDTITVVLSKRKPTSNVIVDISSSDTGEVTVSPSSLTFSSSNYDTAQTVTLTGVNDNVDDGNIVSVISFGFNQSSDDGFRYLDNKTVNATTIDDDTLGIAVTETNGSTDPQEADTDELDITLSSEPLADVTLSVASSDTTEVTVSPSSLTFSSGNYTTAQRVTLTAVQDALIDGDTTPTVTFSVSSTADAGYSALADEVFTATIYDSLLIQDVNEIALGETQSCYVDNDANKTMYCWGGDNCFRDGGCTGPIVPDGVANDNNTLVPIAVGVDNVTSLSISQHLTCALLGDKSVQCWGVNQRGSLGTTSGQLLDGSQVYEAYGLGVGSQHGMVVLDNGTLLAWGYGGFGQLGEGGTTWATNRIAYPNIDNVSQISGGNYFSCALIKDKTIKCWGKNNDGQIGDGTTTNATSPTSVLNLSNMNKVSAGGNHACAVADNGTVWCWGRGDGGKLGNGADSDSSVPVQVSGISTAIDVSTSDLVNCAILSDRTVQCWGGNGDGQLGNGTTGGSSNVPVAVSGLTSVAKIASGFRHNCAIRTDNTVWCWGDNDEGKLGDNSTTDRNTPVQVIGF